MSQGPERATFLERFVTAFHIPFYSGCIILAFLFGPPGAILSVYVQTRNLDESIARTHCLFFGRQIPGWQGIAGLGILLFLLFYILYMIRYMRLRLVSSKPLLVPLLPEGEETFHKIFGRVSNKSPPIILSLMLITPYFLLAAPDVIKSFFEFGTNLVNLVYLVMAYPIWFIIFSTFAWVYFGSILGLRELGKGSLKMKPFYEDKMLGVRPIGSLSFSFAITYFFGLSIIALLPLVLSSDLSSSLVYVGLLLGLTLLGTVFFFLPLYTIHSKMVEVKNRERESLRLRVIKAGELPDESLIRDSESPLSDIKDTLSRLTIAITFNITEKEVENILTWPFDTVILSRLLAMIISIMTIIISNIILQRIIFPAF